MWTTWTHKTPMPPATCSAFLKREPQQKQFIHTIDHIKDKSAIISVSFNNDALVPISIKRTPFNALVDTGSSINCINQRVFYSLFSPHTRLQKCPHIFHAADGGVLKVRGQFKIRFHIQNVPVEGIFYVFPDLSQDVILGRTFMDDYGAQMDFSNKKLHLPRLAALKADKCYTLPPGKTVLVVASCRRSHLPTGLHGSIAAFHHRSGAKTLDTTATVCHHLVPVLVQNPTDRQISVRRGQLIGKFSPISDYQCPISALPEQVGPEETVQHPNSSVHNISAQPTTREKLEWLRGECGIDLEQHSPDIRDSLLDILYSNKDAFVDSSGKLGFNDWVKHKIHLAPHTTPITKQPYRMHPHVRQALQQQIDNLLDQGVLIEGDSAWSSPVIAVRKHVNKAHKHIKKTDTEPEYRLCVDFRYLNAHCLPTQAHIMNIRELIDQVGETKPRYFSALDAKHSFFQMALDPESQPLTAFLFNRRSYQFARTPQGLNSSPMAFQNLAFKILNLIDEKNKVFAYIDDILVTGSTWTEHARILGKTLQAIRSANLKLNGAKCKFAQEEATFLGYQLSSKGVSIAPKHVKAISTWPTPRTPKQVRSLLGVINYYRSWLPSRGDLVRPLTRLTRKNVKFEWSEDCESALQEIKRVLSSKPVLRYPDFEKPFTLYCDASQTALGAVLCQTAEDDELHPVAYLGRATTDQEARWSATELEALCVVYSVKEFSVYLAGKPFEIHTDHQPLLHIFKGTNQPSAKLTRYALFLSDYQYSIKHVAGVQNNVADALSRRTYAETPEEPTDPTEDFPLPLGLPTQKEQIQVQVVTRSQRAAIERELDVERKEQDDFQGEAWQESAVKVRETSDDPSDSETDELPLAQRLTGMEEQVIAASARNQTGEPVASQRPETPTEAAQDEGSDITSLPSIRRAQEQDEFCKDLINMLTDGSLPSDRRRRERCLKREFDFCIKDGVLHQMWSPLPKGDVILRILLPRSLQQAYIKEVHHSTMSAHLGVEKMIGLLRRRVIFKGMYEAVRRFVGSCDVCLAVKHKNKAIHRPPGLYELAALPGERLNCDFAGPFPQTKSGNRYICVVADACSGYCVAWPCRTLTAESFARSFFAKVTCVFGPPKRLISDNATTFRSKLWTAVAEIMGTKLTYSPVYTPQVNGLAESLVGNITQVLRCMVAENETDWDMLLPPALYALNASPHSGHGLAPFTILYGRYPRIPIDAQLEEESEKPLFQIISDIQRGQEQAVETAIKLTALRDRKLVERRPPETHCDDIVPGSVVFWRKSKTVKEGEGKLARSYFGPFLVTERTAYTAKLRDLQTGLMQKFPVSLDQLRVASRYDKQKLEGRLQDLGPVYSTHKQYQAIPNELVNAEQ